MTCCLELNLHTVRTPGQVISIGEMYYYIQTDTQTHRHKVRIQEYIYFVKVTLAQQMWRWLHAHFSVHTSVECPSAVGCPTQTGYLLVLDGKLVVISDFFIGSNVPLGVDNDLLLVAHGDDLGVAVWLQVHEKGVYSMILYAWSLSVSIKCITYYE